MTADHGVYVWRGLVFIALVALAGWAGVSLPLLWANSARVDALEQAVRTHEEAIGLLRAEVRTAARKGEP